MNSNVCVVTIIFLSLENVAGLIYSTATFGPSQLQTPSKEPGDHDLEGTLSFTCVSPNSYHEWYQIYKNDGSQLPIGNISPQTGVNTTRFIIKVEEFDNNTGIYCVNGQKEFKHTVSLVQVFKTVISRTNSCLSYFSKELIPWERIGDNKFCKENEEPTILKYNEKQNVSFSCLEHEHINRTTYIQIGRINTASNMMKTFKNNSTHAIMNISQNGTILYCIYYVVTEMATERWITRFVANKTLLLYTGNAQQDALGGNGTSPESAADQLHGTLIIIAITAVAILFILLVIIVICKKRCRIKPESDSKVLYADLDILRQIKQLSYVRPPPEEESPYAQIIGVMRPQTK